MGGGCHGNGFVKRSWLVYHGIGQFLVPFIVNIWCHVEISRFSLTSVFAENHLHFYM